MQWAPKPGTVFATASPQMRGAAALAWSKEGKQAWGRGAQPVLCGVPRKGFATPCILHFQCCHFSAPQIPPPRSCCAAGCGFARLPYYTQRPLQLIAPPTLHCPALKHPGTLLQKARHTSSKPLNHPDPLQNPIQTPGLAIHPPTTRKPHHTASHRTAPPWKNMVGSRGGREMFYLGPHLPLIRQAYF